MRSSPGNQAGKSWGQTGVTGVMSRETTELVISLGQAGWKKP